MSDVWKLGTHFLEDVKCYDADIAMWSNNVVLRRKFSFYSGKFRSSEFAFFMNRPSDPGRRP